MAGVGLTSLPKEVVFNHLFPYLRFNDLLRLRRTCQWTKPLADDYVRLKASTQRCVKVSLNPEEPDNLAALLDLSLTVPLCSVFIENERNGVQIWDRDMEEPLSKFLTLYGEKITKLKLSHLELPMSSQAIAFFESLPNLVHLQIETVWSTALEQEGNVSTLELPSTFRKLKSCLGVYEWQRDGGTHVDHHKINHSFLDWCQPRLESVAHWSYVTVFVEEDPPANIFQPVRTALVQRQSPVLKEYDLRMVYNASKDDLAIGTDFYQLITTCHQNGVKLQNVDAILIERMFDLEPDNLEDAEEKLSSVIVSLAGLRKECFSLTLPNLEMLELEEWSMGTDFCLMPEQDFERKMWANLKDLRLRVSSAMLDDEFSPTSELLDFLFVGIVRGNMEKLKLIIDDEKDLPFPRALDIGISCPNLKQLSLYGWLENNLAIGKLWEKLPLLEVLEFAKCRELNIQAFMGDNEEEPSFFQLRNLRSLTFRDLDLMSGITDELFIHVLRHMPLKELYLVASENENGNPKRVSQITKAGIKSLRTGVFAESIERFPLTGYLKLRRVSTRRLVSLENKFRAAKML